MPADVRQGSTAPAGPASGPVKRWHCWRVSLLKGEKFMKVFMQTVLCLVLITSCLMGQAARTGTLVGTVTDTTGAIIQSAQITLKNTETAFISKGETNAEGAYYIPFLAVGSYELSVEAAGFKTYV